MRKPTPSYGIIDSQSIKTVGASEQRGIDGGKNERQRTRIHNRLNNICSCEILTIASADVDICHVDNNRKQVPHRVHDYMSLSAFQKDSRPSHNSEYGF